MILQVATSVPPTDITTGSITTRNYLNPSLIEYVTATTISNAQLLALYDTPVNLVPAQGAGSLILVDKVVVDYHFLTAQTTAGGAIAAQYDSTVHGAGVAATATIAAATLNGFAANAVMSVGSVAVSQADTAVYNKGIYLSNATADFATGAGSLVVYTYYRVLTPA
jgi:NAD/NADP transhydrogenase alpha subunit